MSWELKEVDSVDCTLDDSGIYTVINRVAVEHSSSDYEFSLTTIKIRVDILTTDKNTPLISFIGDGNDVRKAVINWLNSFVYTVPNSNEGRHGYSREHASYIGYEISRAMIDVNYVQD